MKCAMRIGVNLVTGLVSLVVITASGCGDTPGLSASFDYVGPSRFEVPELKAPADQGDYELYVDGPLQPDAWRVELNACASTGAGKYAWRIDGEPVVIERVPVSSIYPENLSLASVFQYFIGNTDFSPVATPPGEECCHNQALFTSEEGPYRTIPFDFDQTGLVDARHAEPNPRFGISSVKVRLYRGRCVNNELLPATLQHFQDNRAEIEDYGFIRPADLALTKVVHFGLKTQCLCFPIRFSG